MVTVIQPERIEDHGEEDELAKERDNKGGGGDDLGEEEEEHGQGEQDGDGQGDLGHDALLRWTLFGDDHAILHLDHHNIITG